MCNLSAGIERKGIQKGIQRGIQKGMKRGIKKGMKLGQIRGAISVYRDIQLPEQEILQNLEKKFHLTPDQARQYFDRYKVPIP